MKIKFNLSESSINQAIRQLKQYQKEYNSKIEKFKKRLGELGVQYAKLNLMSMQKYDTLYDIANSINSKIQGDKVLIICNDDVGIFVEFGTGVLGNMKKHPKSNELGWKYMVNKGNYVEYNGKKGWWYITNENDQNTNKRLIADGILIAFTQGMEARPFMHETAKRLKDEIYDIAKEIFSEN